jgi:hypothetical protein
VLDQLQSERHISTIIPRERRNERRDIQRTIDLWQRNLAEGSALPDVETFDFSPMKQDWGYRFLICSDLNLENAAFVMYGAQLARLLALPEKVQTIVPLFQQIAERYQPIFAEGCSKAMTQAAPARFSGTFDYDFQVELYRGVFLPIRLHRSWSKRLIFGSLSYRKVLSIDRTAP